MVFGYYIKISYIITIILIIIKYREECEKFKQLSDPAEISKRSQEIFDRFVKEEASHQVNLPSNVIKEIKNNLATPTAKMYDKGNHSNTAEQKYILDIFPSWFSCYYS